MSRKLFPRILFYVIFALIFITANTQSYLELSQNEIVYTHTYYDLKSNPFPEFITDVALGNTISFNGSGMYTNATAHTFAHIQMQTTDKTVRRLETNISLVSGTFGASWGPGIGIWWNNENNIHLNFDGSIIRYVAKHNNESFLTRLELGSINANFTQLRIDINSSGYIFPLYNLNGDSWVDYWTTSYIQEAGEGTMIPIITAAVDPAQDPLIMLGKGYSSAFYSLYPSAVGLGEEFNTFYLPDNGTFGFINYNYISFELGEEQAKSNSNSNSFSSISRSQPNSNTLSSNPSTIENPTEENFTSPTPILPLPISNLFVGFAVAFLWKINKVKIVQSKILTN